MPGRSPAPPPRLPLRSPHLTLRPLTVEDVPALAAYRSDPEVCRYVPFTPQSEELVRSRIEHEYAARDLAAEGDVVILAIEVASTGTVVGDVMLRLASAAHRTGELGYVVNPAHGGHGYATEAAHTLLHLAFDELGWHRVVARVDARNTASADVARRLGMRQEAHHVENEWFKGEWSDELTFALLDREWRSQHDDPLPWCPPGIP